MTSRDQTTTGDPANAAERAVARTSARTAASDAPGPPTDEGEVLRRSVDELRARLAEIQAIEAQLQTEIGRFYVSASQLGASIAREPIVQVIREILANLVGSEEVAIVSIVSPSPNGTPALLFDFGGETDWEAWSARARACVGEVLRSGRSFYRESEWAPRAEGASGDREATACIALRAGTRVVGAVAIFGLLPQKEGLTGFDRDLCEMVGSLGGQALYCSELHASSRGQELPVRF